MTPAGRVLGSLAAFAVEGPEAPVPPEVRHEAARIVLDSVGCALASVDSQAGEIGRRYGALVGGSSTESVVLGAGERSSTLGAAYANSELIAALDFAPINQPGHVAPYVVPAALGAAEAARGGVDSVLDAVARGLEITHRFAISMDTNRAVVDGAPVLSGVMGFSSAVFAVAAAAGRIRGATRARMEDALAIAAATAPVNSLRSWQMHTPNTSVKYGVGGGLVLAGLHAVHMAEFGHRGDRSVLDDPEWGYPRFIGTSRWEPDTLVGGLGEEWLFPGGTHYKPYPHCRVTHAVFDALGDLVAGAALDPSEIESITVHGEAWASGVPTYMNDVIERPYDAQFSFNHGIAVVAHGVKPGKAWQDPAVVQAHSVLDLMTRIEWLPHEGWADAWSAHPSARPTRVTVRARGRTFVEERDFPRGSVTPDPATRFTDADLIAKFRHNAEGVIDDRAAERAVEVLLGGGGSARALMVDLAGGDR